MGAAYSPGLLQLLLAKDLQLLDTMHCMKPALHVAACIVSSEEQHGYTLSVLGMTLAGLSCIVYSTLIGFPFLALCTVSTAWRHSAIIGHNAHGLFLCCIQDTV